MTEWNHWGKTVKDLSGEFPVRIVEDTDGIELIEFKVGDKYGVTFNSMWIQEKNLKWFAEVLSRELDRIYQITKHDTKQEVKNKLKELLDVIEFR